MDSLACRQGWIATGEPNHGQRAVVQRLKAALSGKAAKTVSNMLTLLNVVLKCAMEVTCSSACRARSVSYRPKGSVAFHDFGAYERLVDAAERLDAQRYHLVLLGAMRGCARVK